MRVILKPGGVCVLVGLCIICVGLGAKKFRDAASTPRASAAVDWTGAKQVLALNITASDWRDLQMKGKFTTATVPSTLNTFITVRKIAITEIGEKSWDLQLSHPLNLALHTGSQMRLTFWARSKSANMILASIEKTSESHENIAFASFPLTSEWKQYSVPWKPLTETKPDEVQLVFHLSHQVGELEITGVAFEQK
jgi:hypothetical protein